MQQNNNAFKWQKCLFCNGIFCFLNKIDIEQNTNERVNSLDFQNLIKSPIMSADTSLI